MDTGYPQQSKRVENVCCIFSDFTLSKSKVKFWLEPQISAGSYQTTFIPQHQILSTILLFDYFITVHVSSQKNTYLKLIPSAYPLSFILLITPRSLFLLPKDFINCLLALSPLHNYDSSITCCPVVILNRSTFYSQRCSNFGNKLYSHLGYNYWCLQQTNVSLSISDFLMPYLFSFNDTALQPTLIIHSHDPTLKLLTKY